MAKCYHNPMSQPVKLSDVLVLDARLTGQIGERSITGQIEYWANLGRAIEPLLRGIKPWPSAKWPRHALSRNA